MLYAQGLFRLACKYQGLRGFLEKLLKGIEKK